MPRNSRSDSISSESESDDIPESFSLLQSKKDTQRLEAERRNADTVRRRAIKEKNRGMDRKLKERAVMNERGKGNITRERRQKVDEKKGSEQRREPDELEKRMQRAMKEAEDESDSDDDETTTKHPDHLPDELFAAAFSSSSRRKRAGDDTTPTPPTKKQKSSEKTDIVVGSCAIRILSNSSAPPVPSTMPSKKNDKFLNRVLALEKGTQNLHTKGWERRPVNIGVFKRNGPPVSFVRK